MYRKHNKALTGYARQLRQGMTQEERKLWYEFLRGYPVRFLRQKVIGQYIVDFYCAQAGLVLEVDGGQHYEERQKAYDEERTKMLNNNGIEVIRIANNEIDRNFLGVCQYLELRIENMQRGANHSGAKGASSPTRGASIMS